MRQGGLKLASRPCAFEEKKKEKPTISGTFLVEGPGKSRKNKREKFPRLAGAFCVLVAYQLLHRSRSSHFFVSDQIPSAVMPPQALRLEPRRVTIE